MRGAVKLFPFTAAKPMIAKIEANQFELRKRPFILYNDTGFAHCFGELLPSSTGTIIKGRFGPGKVWGAYLTLWTAGATLIGIPFLVLTLVRMMTGPREPNDWIGIIVPLFLMSFGYGFLLLPPRSGSRQRFYLDFLRSTLAAVRKH